jgi:hypothetical protein
MVIFWEIHVFLQVSWIGLFGAKRAYLQLETFLSSCRKYFFQKLSQFTQGKNVLDVPAFTTDGFLWRVTCVSSTYLNRSIWNKMNISSSGKVWLQNYFFQKSIPFSQGNNVLDAPASKTEVFLWRYICFFNLAE